MSAVQMLGAAFIALGVGVVIGWAFIYWSDYRAWKRGMDDVREALARAERGWQTKLTQAELKALNRRPSTKQRSKR